ncbi:hypothetical protein WDU94_013467 [Cyamophila willieti]
MLLTHCGVMRLKAMQSICFISTLTLFSTLMLPSSSSTLSTTTNRSDLMYCLHCKGADDTCLSTNTTNVRSQLCAGPCENCYTMVQKDDERRIITRGCAHDRFCATARKICLYNLKYCAQCASENCNNEDLFTYEDLCDGAPTHKLEIS